MEKIIEGNMEQINIIFKNNIFIIYMYIIMCF
jgi:hypothetical protein